MNNKISFIIAKIMKKRKFKDIVKSYFIEIIFKIKNYKYVYLIINV